MYQLTVISGPSRGSVFPLLEGEAMIGRQSGNAIVLSSGKISKQHCQLIADASGVLLRDLGSSNGTFVNGILIKVKRLVPGDRVTVGDITLELTRKSMMALVPQEAPVQGNLVAFSPPQMSGSPVSAAQVPAKAPQNPIEKLRALIEEKVMPIFYGMLFKNQWRVVIAVIFALYAVGNLVVSLTPILQANRDSILVEAQRRAVFMAKQMAEQNAAILATGQEAKTHTAGADTGDFVRTAYLTDLELRVLAPAKMANQYFVAGPEAVFAKKASTLFKEGRERGASTVVADTIVVAVEPVRVYIAASARNTAVAMAVVAIDASPSIPGFEDLSIVYSETLILTLVLGAILFFVLYRVTLKPFEVLNDDMDRVLKGDLAQVTHEFKWDELNPLWDLIRSALQRAVRTNGGAGDLGGGFDQSGASTDEVAAPFKLLGSVASLPVVVCDVQQKVVYMSPLFEEISGIRAEAAVGQELTSLARDQSFGALVTDLFARAPGQGDGLSEDYDFSGVAYRMHVSAVGNSGNVTAYVLVAQRQNAEAAA